MSRGQTGPSESVPGASVKSEGLQRSLPLHETLLFAKNPHLPTEDASGIAAITRDTGK